MGGARPPLRETARKFVTASLLRGGSRNLLGTGGERSPLRIQGGCAGVASRATFCPVLPPRDAEAMRVSACRNDLAVLGSGVRAPSAPPKNQRGYGPSRNPSHVLAPK